MTSTNSCKRRREEAAEHNLKLRVSVANAGIDRARLVPFSTSVDLTAAASTLVSEVRAAVAIGLGIQPDSIKKRILLALPEYEGRELDEAYFSRDATDGGDMEIHLNIEVTAACQFEIRVNRFDIAFPPFMLTAADVAFVARCPTDDAAEYFKETLAKKIGLRLEQISEVTLTGSRELALFFSELTRGAGGRSGAIRQETLLVNIADGCEPTKPQAAMLKPTEHAAFIPSRPGVQLGDYERLVLVAQKDANHPTNVGYLIVEQGKGWRKDLPCKLPDALVLEIKYVSTHYSASTVLHASNQLSPHYEARWSYDGVEDEQIMELTKLWTKLTEVDSESKRRRWYGLHRTEHSDIFVVPSLKCFEWPHLSIYICPLHHLTLHVELFHRRRLPVVLDLDMCLVETFDFQQVNEDLMLKRQGRVFVRPDLQRRQDSLKRANGVHKTSEMKELTYLCEEVDRLQSAAKEIPRAKADWRNKELANMFDEVRFLLHDDSGMAEQRVGYLYLPSKDRAPTFLVKSPRLSEPPRVVKLRPGVPELLQRSAANRNFEWFVCTRAYGYDYIGPIVRFLDGSYGSANDEPSSAYRVLTQKWYQCPRDARGTPESAELKSLKKMGEKLNRGYCPELMLILDDCEDGNAWGVDRLTGDFKAKSNWVDVDKDSVVAIHPYYAYPRYDLEWDDPKYGMSGRGYLYASEDKELTIFLANLQSVRRAFYRKGLDELEKLLQNPKQIQDEGQYCEVASFINVRKFYRDIVGKAAQANPASPRGASPLSDAGCSPRSNALDGDVSWKKRPEKVFGDGTVLRTIRPTDIRDADHTMEQKEFNFAAHQLIRLVDKSRPSKFTVTQVDVYESPTVLDRWHEKQKELSADSEAREDKWVFHGTDAAELICRTGFKVGGVDAGVDARNGKRHGFGVYTALGPNTPITYSQKQGIFSVILSRAVLGKQGESPGKNSHPRPGVDCWKPKDPNPNEADWIIFASGDQLLPRYVVHWRYN